MRENPGGVRFSGRQLGSPRAPRLSVRAWVCECVPTGSCWLCRMWLPALQGFLAQPLGTPHPPGTEGAGAAGAEAGLA